MAGATVPAADAGLRFFRLGCFLTIFALFTSAATDREETPVIVNSGSTNVPGYRIELDRSGNAKLTTGIKGLEGSAGEDAGPRSVPRELAERLYKDLRGAEPLGSLKPVNCFKSASFGFTLSVEFGKEKTPDLACGDDGNPKLKALIQDVNEIVKAVIQGN